jgi:hypothetical protein
VYLKSDLSVAFGGSSLIREELIYYIITSHKSGFTKEEYSVNQIARIANAFGQIVKD